MLYPFKRFKGLGVHRQIEQLQRHGVPLDLAFETIGAETTLFAYNDFYVELFVDTRYDEILRVKCFRSTRKLGPYLKQVDISFVTALLSCGSN